MRAAWRKSAVLLAPSAVPLLHCALLGSLALLPQAVKGQIAVNPKRLYKADQTAVPELLKVAGFLYGE